MKKKFKSIISGVTVAAGLVVGFAGFSVFANSSSSPFIYADQEQKVLLNTKAPTYSINQSGETYGSAMYARTESEMPDLAAAIGDNGVLGYIRLSESMGEMPSSPEEAIAMQNRRSTQAPLVVSLYAEDGITVLDTFTISNNDNTHVTYDYTTK